MYDGVNGNDDGALFNGIKFWVDRRVPQRSSVLEKIRVSVLVPLLLLCKPLTSL